MRKRSSVFLLVLTLTTAVPAFPAASRDLESREPFFRRLVRIVQRLAGVRSDGDHLRPPTPCDPSQQTCT